ncbi:MAG: hypothetical protein AAF790_14525, partial [Planctomycetota bacterium]
MSLLLFTGCPTAFAQRVQLPATQPSAAPSFTPPATAPGYIGPTPSFDAYSPGGAVLSPGPVYGTPAFTQPSLVQPGVVQPGFGQPGL